MDELSRQAYLNLIQSLLICPSGEENQILQANSELVDAGLVQVMLEEANNLRIDNNLDNANSLMTLAGHLMGIYGNTMPDKSSPSTYLTFLTEVLQVTADSNGDRKVIYDMLRANINLVNDNLAVVLRNWARETLPNSDSQRRISLTTVIGNFCNAIRQFPLGSMASNLEIAIAGYEVALTVFTRQEYPENWARTQNNLAITYNNRIRGERADNLEMAISAYTEALSVYTRETYPEDWAITQNNLGTAYYQRIREEKAENLELAIAAFLAALEIRTCEEFPQEWAMTQNNLGNAYRDRLGGEKADNIEMAISAYQAALEVYTRESFPEAWARTQNNLGNAYRDRIRDEKADNIEMAICAFRKALLVYTREAFPEAWAITQNNLANAYCNRIRGKKADNLEKAITASQAALLVSTREAFPINHAQTLYNLGRAYRDNFQLPAAYKTFNTAIETVELMRSEIIRGGEADRQKLAEEYNRIYHLMVEVCLEMENKTAALEYIERSKTRNLVELFHNARSLPQNVQRISFQEIRSLLGEDEAILEWYITFNGFKVFIITHDSTQPDVWQSSDADWEALIDFASEYIDDYIYQNDNWEKQLEISLGKLAKILHIDEIISRLPESCQRLILVPFRYLHLLPLHALTSRRLKQNVEETGCLLELFPGGVRYTPSCQLLQLSQRVNPTGEDSSPTRLFAIQNPTEDLDFTDIEVEAIAKSFNPAEVLIREKASKTGLQQQLKALQNADIAHFSCHGFFDFNNPRKSALILAGAKITTDGADSENKSYIRSPQDELLDIEKCLTLEEIFDLRLSKCSLVTLSACETGLTDIRDNTDEYIGLPSGFFYAGATSVISTLWAVNDASTAILMIKFYEIFLSETRPPVAIALRESQLWLRDATVQDLVDWVASCKLISDERKEEIQNSIEFGQRPENKRYQSPYFWAAFCAIGQ
ncbi:CHAT domain-containing protein [Microcoleus sp.]|uniref:CHAT domain-containing protein n=1 Tax=Microcoleus sp. TaxID=44472 RepID=UPI00403E43F5